MVLVMVGRCRRLASLVVVCCCWWSPVSVPLEESGLDCVCPVASVEHMVDEVWSQTERMVSPICVVRSV